MRLYEGNILTCDKENRIAHYLLEDQGKILYCGDELPAGCVAAERVSTGEGALIPPFVDSHIHFASYATFHAGLNVMNARSNEEILQMLREHLRDLRSSLRRFPTFPSAETSARKPPCMRECRRQKVILQ